MEQLNHIKAQKHRYNCALLKSDWICVLKVKMFEFQSINIFGLCECYFYDSIYCGISSFIIEIRTKWKIRRKMGEDKSTICRLQMTQEMAYNNHRLYSFVLKALETFATTVYMYFDLRRRCLKIPRWIEQFTCIVRSSIFRESSKSNINRKTNVSILMLAVRIKSIDRNYVQVHFGFVRVCSKCMQRFDIDGWAIA